jgi:trk system potassium uptake protein TrkH
MALGTFIMLVAHIKMDYGQYSVLMQSYTPGMARTEGYVLRQVVKVTLLVEGVGACVLFSQFGELPLGERAFAAIFHAVSAFCNAGFSLYPDSMVRYQANPVVNWTLMLLIVCGGFGFLALSEVLSFKNRKKIAGASRFSLHTRLVMAVIAVLLPLGCLALAFFDWNGALADLSVYEKFQAALFHSVSTRSGGLNTVAVSAFSASSLFLMMLLMFIGANPGSCGGGIKTTTAAVMWVQAMNRFLGREKSQVMNRTIPEETVERSVRIFVLSMVVVVATTVLLLVTETWNDTARQSHAEFLEILFEAISAFSTCGMSIGVTPHLSWAGELVVCVAMFVGRLGPLVLVQAVSNKSAGGGAYYTEEDIMVG